MKTHVKKFAFVLLLPLLPALQACGGAGAWEGTVTDSAGVAIVNNTPTPMWRANDAWTVEEDLRIGSVGGDPNYQFTTLGFIDAGPDGTIYATDNMVMEVKAFDAQGNYLRTLGGPGSGPGELSQQAIFVYVEDDGTVIVPDVGTRRVNRYSATGEPIGGFPIEIQAGVPTLWVLDDQGRLMTQLRGLNIPGMAALDEGDPIVVYDSTGAVVDTVAVLPKGQTLSGISEEQFSMVLFSPEPVWDLAPDGSIYYAMNDQFRILVNDPDGNLVRVIRKEAPRKLVEDRDKDAIRRLLREQWTQVGLPGAQIEQLMQGIGFAEYFPAFGQLFIGPEETLWVQRIRSSRDMADAAGEEVEFDPQDIGSPEWEVFDAQGRFLGVVTMPDRFLPVNVEGEDIYGVWRDELDVQYIMRLQVNRPAN